MKTASEESRLRWLPVLDSAEDEIFDFLYVDRARVSALYAQLFPQGVLTGVKTSAQQGSAVDSTLVLTSRFLKPKPNPRIVL